jgi:CRP-like cAMP-binding protein
MNPSKSAYKNRVLATLPKADITRLERLLSPVTLKQEQTLSDGKTTHAYFLEDGMASAVVTLENGGTVEVGVIGFEGLVGFSILLGTEGAPGRTFIQIAGSGYRIKGQDLKEEFERGGPFRIYLLKYLQGFLVQASQTAACNRMHNIEERLARWLLTCRERTNSDQLRLTHDFLGQMLGAPRTTVTLAAGLLHRAGMIKYSRGTVTIQNLAQLKNTACECYRIVRDEFQRLDLL